VQLCQHLLTILLLPWFAAAFEACQFNFGVKNSLSVALHALQVKRWQVSC
jgi:hypothetical protein